MNLFIYLGLLSTAIHLAPAVISNSAFAMEGTETHGSGATSPEQAIQNAILELTSDESVQQLIGSGVRYRLGNLRSATDPKSILSARTNLARAVGPEKSRAKFNLETANSESAQDQATLEQLKAAVTFYQQLEALCTKVLPRPDHPQALKLVSQQQQYLVERSPEQEALHKVLNSISTDFSFRTPRVFFLYSSPNANQDNESWLPDFVRHFASHLEMAGIHVEVETTNQGPTPDLEQKINASDHFVIFGTLSSEKELGPIRTEVSQVAKLIAAQQRGKYFHPFLLNSSDETSIPSVLRTGRREIAQISVFKQTELGYLNLLREMIERVHPRFPAKEFDKYWSILGLGTAQPQFNFPTPMVVETVAQSTHQPPPQQPTTPPTPVTMRAERAELPKRIRTSEFSPRVHFCHAEAGKPTIHSLTQLVKNLRDADIHATIDTLDLGPGVDLEPFYREKILEADTIFVIGSPLLRRDPVDCGDMVAYQLYVIREAKRRKPEMNIVLIPTAATTNLREQFPDDFLGVYPVLNMVGRTDSELLQSLIIMARRGLSGI